MSNTDLFARVVGELKAASARAKTLNSKVRLARAIGALGPRSAPLIPSLMAYLEQPGSLRENAVDALAGIGFEAKCAIPELSRILLARKPWADRAHWAAALSLGRIGTKTAIVLLTRAIQIRDEEGPAPFALDELHRLGPFARSALPVLRRLTQDPQYLWSAKAGWVIASILRSNS